MDEIMNGSNELKQAWKKLSEQKFSNSKIKKQEIMEAIKSDSHTSIMVLKKGLKNKLRFAVLFMFMFIGLAIGDSNQSIQTWFYGVMVLMYTLISLLLFQKYRKMDDGLDQNKSVLENLKHNASTIRSMLFVERLWGIIACSAIFIYYIFKFIENGSNNNTLLIQIVIFAVILIALGFWAENANKKKFGNKLKELEDNVVRLETLN